jgi:hypothetical protein
VRVIQVLLGHAKLETTALYTRVATNTIREVMSPLDRLTPLRPKKDEPPAWRAAAPLAGSKLEVADIFRRHGPAWRQANAGHLSLGQLKVMAAIESCRTAALGGKHPFGKLSVWVGPAGTGAGVRDVTTTVYHTLAGTSEARGWTSCGPDAQSRLPKIRNLISSD